MTSLVGKKTLIFNSVIQILVTHVHPLFHSLFPLPKKWLAYILPSMFSEYFWAYVHVVWIPSPTEFFFFFWSIPWVSCPPKATVICVTSPYAVLSLFLYFPSTTNTRPWWTVDFAEGLGKIDDSAVKHEQTTTLFCCTHTKKILKIQL